MVTTVPERDPDANPLAEEAQQLNRAESDIVAEIEALDRREAEPEVETLEAAPAVPPEPGAVPPSAEVPPIPTAPPLAPPLTDAGVLQRQLRETQERLQRYETQEQEASLDREVAQYQAQLEAQGWEESQAKVVAQQAKQQFQRETQLQEGARIRELNQMGKFYAALHFGQTHGIDPRELLQYDTPQAMEGAAKTQAELKTLKDQVEKLTQQQVPPSQYETGQPARIGGRSETTLLKAYSEGDRSPQAVAAAKKAAGL